MSNKSESEALRRSKRKIKVPLKISENLQRIGKHDKSNQESSSVKSASSSTDCQRPFLEPNPDEELHATVRRAYGHVRRVMDDRNAQDNSKLWSQNRAKLVESFKHPSLNRPPISFSFENYSEENEALGPPVKVTLYSEGHKPKVQLVRTSTLGWMDRIPNVLDWTAIPFNMAEEDGKFLTNIPFLGDDIIDKDRKFFDHMLNLYQGNIHDTANRSQTPQRLSESSLQELVKHLQTSTHFGDEETKAKIFDTISKALPGNGSGTELQNKHGSILSRKPASSVSGKPVYSIPNVDTEDAKDLPREKTMHAFQCLFCRRCYQYDCPRGHNGDDQVDLAHCKKNSEQQNISYECENPNCWRKIATDTNDNSLCTNSSESEWTVGEKSFFRALISSFPDPCYVAKLMLTKSCTEVKEFASLEEQNQIDETSKSLKTASSITPTVNGCSSKKKSKKSSSVSKKNLSRRWINNVVKRSDGMSLQLPARFMPCQHHKESSECDEKTAGCYCAKNGTSCEKFCSCPPTCKRRFPGCRCTSTCDSRRCVCFVAARECDPDLCTGCGANEPDMQKATCRNSNIQRRLHKHLLMAKSSTHGWGIFIKEEAQRGEFIAEYRGEIISHDESERRGHVYDKKQHTFLFELNDHFVVDATRKGNKARFVNSTKSPNCEVKRMLVNGDHRIGIYAKKFIDSGEELFYDYEDVLEKQRRATVAQAQTSESASGSSKKY